MAAVWGSKFPANSEMWEVEADPKDVGLVAFMRLPKVNRATLKMLLVDGQCQFAGIPLGSAVATGFATSTDAGSGAKYWSLITFTRHQDADAAKAWLAKFQSEDTFAQITGTKSQLPPPFPHIVNNLGGLWTCCGVPEKRYEELPQEEMSKEQLDINDLLASAPPWAKEAGGWYMINLQTMHRFLSSNCLEAFSSVLYGQRMLHHFSTSFGKILPVSSYQCCDVIVQSQKIPYEPKAFVPVKYDLEMGGQMFRSKYFKSWLPFKGLAATDAWITFPLDADCSQWDRQAE